MIEQVALAALVVRQAVELIVAPFYDNLKGLENYKWTQQYWAFAVGIGLAFLLNLDVLVVAGLDPSVLGLILTGIGLGAGADVIHSWSGG